MQANRSRLVLTTTRSTVEVRALTQNGMARTLGRYTSFLMPDWSPDGTQIAGVIPAAGANVQDFGIEGRASIALFPWDGMQLGAPRILTPSPAEANYYPHFSPDGSWLVFNRASQRTNNASDALLWAIDARATAPTPVLLARANGTAMNAANSWPRFAPFEQTYRGQTLYWFTFSSARSRTGVPSRPQLWMSALLPSRLPGDPSTPAFWLTLQDPMQGNHLAQWAQQVPRRRCTQDSDCAAGEMCRVLASAGQCFLRE